MEQLLTVRLKAALCFPYNTIVPYAPEVVFMMPVNHVSSEGRNPLILNNNYYIVERTHRSFAGIESKSEKLLQRFTPAYCTDRKNEGSNTVYTIHLIYRYLALFARITAFD